MRKSKATKQAEQAVNPNDFTADTLKSGATSRDPWVSVPTPSDAAIGRVLKGEDLSELNRLSDLGRQADKVVQYAPFMAEVYQKTASAQIAQDDLHTKIVETDNRQIVSQLRNELRRMTSNTRTALAKIQIGTEAQNVGHELSEDHRDAMQLLATGREVKDALRSQSTGQKLADLNNQVEMVRVQVNINQEQHEIDSAKNFVDPRLAAVPSFIRPGYAMAEAPKEGSQTGNPIKDVAIAVVKAVKLW